VQSAQFPLDTIQPAMRAFWHTYTAEAGAALAPFEEAMATSVQYAAVRMIQSAYEQVVNASEITPHAVLLLQLSANILRDPGSAVRDLLGM